MRATTVPVQIHPVSSHPVPPRPHLAAVQPIPDSDPPSPAAVERRESEFSKWLSGVKKAKWSEGDRIRVPGDIISLGEDVCSCRICPCGCYTRNDEGKLYYIVKRQEGFVHEKCGDKVD